MLNGVSKTIASEDSVNKSRAAANSKTDTSIEAHESTNTLVITGQPDMLRALESVIRQLDVPRAQVHIEAIIVEVYESDGAQFGVQWYSEAGGFTQFTNGSASISSVAAAGKLAEGTDGDIVPAVYSSETGKKISDEYRKKMIPKVITPYWQKY